MPALQSYPIAHLGNSTDTRVGHGPHLCTNPHRVTKFFPRRRRGAETLFLQAVYAASNPALENSSEKPLMDPEITHMDTD
jgi:hypothetical protein